MNEGGKGGSGVRQGCVQGRAGEVGGGKIGKENRLSPVIRGGGIPLRRGVKAGRVRRGERRLKFIDKKGRREREREEGETMFGIKREETIICID